jgi:MSHA biogenesis protein MshJ
MKARLSRWAETIDSLGLRERVFLLLSLVAVLFLLVDSLVYQPALAEQRRTLDVIDNLQTRLAVLEHESRLVAEDGATDPLGWRKRRVTELETSLASLDDRIRDQLGILVDPRLAAPLLRDIIDQEQDLTLIELHTGLANLDPSLQRSLATDSASYLPANLGRYELTLHLEGSYMATLRFLERLEALPWALFSEQLDLDVEQHPKARITLRLYTLGAYGSGA